MVILAYMSQYGRIAVGAVGGALLTWCVFVLALALATIGSTIADAVVELPSAFRRAVPAIITLVLTVPLVLRIHRRRRQLLGLRRPGRVLVGIIVTVCCAAVAFTPAVLAGWISITEIDPPVLLSFLATNTALALALEAVPEELVFRGSAYGSIRTVGPSWIAAITATAAFVVAPAASIAVAAALGHALGLPTPPATFAPGGQNPVDYAVLLTVFSLCLILAREAAASVWASVGVHLSFLTINRLTFPGHFTTGVTTTVEPGTELLVLGYLLAASVVFAVIRYRRLRGRRIRQHASAVL